jgi:hypothetical protein
MEKLRADFNSSGKGSVDHIAQIRIGINDVPYDILPRVVPAVPSGYSETQQDAENAWNELIAKFKGLILSSFDKRVSQYEDDIKEKDAQRSLPGWNFCTFFILKEGLARGFENVGLVEDALVGYDELSVGLDSVIHEQAQAGSPERHGGALLSYTEELKRVALKALSEAEGHDGEDEEAVDLQSRETVTTQFDDICISPDKKPYRDMILANNVSVFDFRCYVFARQIALLLRLGNALCSRGDLLAKLQEQQESLLHGGAPPVPPKQNEGSENLAILAEVCRRTLQFIPPVSQVMRQDIAAAVKNERLAAGDSEATTELDPVLVETMDNLVASFAFSVAQQILAQTSSKALPMPPSSLASADDQKMALPEPKTMMHPARTASMQIRPSSRPPPSPGLFPGPGRRMSVSELEAQQAQFLKTGLEELAARRAELYQLSRSILNGLGKKRGWSDGWKEAPVVGEPDISEMEEVSLDDAPATTEETAPSRPLVYGVESGLLRTAIDSVDDFYGLYEIMTDAALRHYTTANQDHAVQSNMADLAVLKYHQKDYRAAASYFYRTTPFFGESGWSMLELSMLIMYSQCLHELQSNEDYVRVTLKLLTKACAAERERLEQKSAVLLAGQKQLSDMGPLKGVAGNLFELAKGLPTVAKVPLVSFFSRVELVGAPSYEEQRDSCSLTFQFRSLLPEEVTVDHISLKISSVDGGPCKEILFEKKDKTVLNAGKNTVTVTSNVSAPSGSRVGAIANRYSRLCPENTESAILTSQRITYSYISIGTPARRHPRRRTFSRLRM